MASLSPGTRVGPYEILASLGAGGMGEVYRARDTRLDRVVAIKRLLPEWAADHTRRERLTREARAIARLAHPHICTLHDVATEGDEFFLVMEYVEGDTLESRLARMPAGRTLPLDDALPMAADIADALAFAHSRGIVHRDVKPANIMLTATGAKLLDFGLARIPETGDATDAPTRTVLTDERTIMGTLPYMAPEQLDGRADARSDIFALGAVLFETLTGTRAFTGATASSIIAAVVQYEPPPVTTLRRESPPALDRVLRRCLAKKPDARWQSAADLADELRWIAGLPLEARIPSARGASAPDARRRWLQLGSAVLMTGLVVGLSVWSLARRSAPVPSDVSRLTITLPPSTHPTGSLDVSPDGLRIVYVAGSAEGRPSLYVRALDSFEPLPLTGTDGASAPFFSFDGQSIAFFADGKLKRVPAAGGAVANICDAPAGSSGAWGHDDTIVFGNSAARAGLSRVPASGGVPGVLTTPDPREEGGHAYPAFVGATGAVLYTTTFSKTGVQPSVRIHSLQTGEDHKVADGNSRVRYAASGHLIFMRSSTVIAVPFDADKLRVTGPQVAVLDDVVNGTLAISTGGRLVYRPAQPLGGTLVWVDRKGASEALGPVGEFEMPRLSPDGRRLVMNINKGNEKDIGIYQFDNHTLTQITTNGVNNSPYWTPDGKRIIYRAPGKLMSQPADGSSAPEVFLDSADPALTATSALAPGAFSADGSQYAFVVHASANTAADVWTMHLVGERRIGPLVKRPGNQWGVRVSPDGQWVSYSSDESGRFEMWIERLAGGGKHQVSTNGGIEGVWSPAGDELFYVERDRMMSVPLTGNLDSPTGVPRVVFQGQYVSSPIPQYDVTRDGRRFVMVKPTTDDTADRTIRVIGNWFQELTRRAPVSR